LTAREQVKATPLPVRSTRTGSRARTRSRSRLRVFAGQAADFLFLVPALVLVGGLLLIPIGIGIVRSLYNWDPGYTSSFVGFANYTELAGSDIFREIMKNEGFYLLAVPVWVVLPLGIALFLFERVPFAGVCRTLIFYPAVASPAILGIFFRGVLAPTGLINSVLRAVGLDGLARNWLSDPHLVKPVLVCVIAWASAGTGVVIFSAALSALDPTLLEAADVEGATGLQRLRYVVLPAVRPVVDLYTALMVLMVFVGLFGWIYVLTGGGPGFSSTTLDYDIYQHALTYGQFGVAAAESVYLLGIVAIIVVLTRRMRKLGAYA
jgi:multiple sugar transport system permease protein